jgi:hypothetical protein
MKIFDLCGDGNTTGTVSFFGCCVLQKKVQHAHSNSRNTLHTELRRSSNSVYKSTAGCCGYCCVQPYCRNVTAVITYRTGKLPVITCDGLNSTFFKKYIQIQY